MGEQLAVDARDCEDDWWSENPENAEQAFEAAYQDGIVFDKKEHSLEDLSRRGSLDFYPSTKVLL